jgi:hypothetical protein
MPGHFAADYRIGGEVVKVELVLVRFVAYFFIESKALLFFPYGISGKEINHSL